MQNEAGKGISPSFSPEHDCIVESNLHSILIILYVFLSSFPAHYSLSLIRTHVANAAWDKRLRPNKNTGWPTSHEGVPEPVRGTSVRMDPGIEVVDAKLTLSDTRVTASMCCSLS